MSPNQISSMVNEGNVVAVDEKRKRYPLRTRIVMDFDPKPSLLHNQEEVDRYLEKHHRSLLLGIKVKWCHPV